MEPKPWTSNQIIVWNNSNWRLSFKNW